MPDETNLSCPNCGSMFYTVTAHVTYDKFFCNNCGTIGMVSDLVPALIVEPEQKQLNSKEER
jgi:DNA-directed RNA polymerase subunit M/transcription elongation factor TFIIS